MEGEAIHRGTVERGSCCTNWVILHYQPVLRLEDACAALCCCPARGAGIWGDDHQDPGPHIPLLCFQICCFISLTFAFSRNSLQCCNPELSGLLWCRGSESALC